MNYNTTHLMGRDNPFEYHDSEIEFIKGKAFIYAD